MLTVSTPLCELFQHNFIVTDTILVVAWHHTYIANVYCVGAATYSSWSEGFYILHILALNPVIYSKHWRWRMLKALWWSGSQELFRNAIKRNACIFGLATTSWFLLLGITQQDLVNSHLDYKSCVITISSMGLYYLSSVPSYNIKNNDMGIIQILPSIVHEKAITI